MTEKTISISGLTSVDVYGVNDRKLDRMRHFFPDVRIVARGTEIRLEGPDDNVERLALRIETMLNALRKGEEISDSDLEGENARLADLSLGARGKGAGAQ